jgi:hypothetical protein
MALKGQSIRNGVSITLNGEKADKADNDIPREDVNFREPFLTT